MENDILKPIFFSQSQDLCPCHGPDYKSSKIRFVQMDGAGVKSQKRNASLFSHCAQLHGLPKRGESKGKGDRGYVA